MEYTEGQKGIVKQEFAARRKRQIILAVPLVAIVIGFAVLADERNGGTALFVVLRACLLTWTLVFH